MVDFYDPLKHGPQQSDGEFGPDPRIKINMEEHDALIAQGLPIPRSRFGQRIVRLEYLTSRSRKRTDIKVLTRKRRFERTFVGQIWLALKQLVHTGERE